MCMKKSILKTNLITFTILLVLTCITCKKDDEEKSVVKAGNWTGTDISFTVGGNPLKISNLDFAYSGHATGTICSYDYESGASFVSVADIKTNVFTAALNTFEISGSFLTDTTAEIGINWTIHDSNCDANYSGSKTYTASYNSSH